jgi:hypothetical protein
MKKSRNELMNWLSKHMDFVETTENFSGAEGGIWLSGENGDEYNGHTIYSYYAQGKAYELGVLNEWEEKLNKWGWYSQWYDCGTIMLYKI